MANKIDSFEVEELAASICDIDSEETEEIEEALQAKYDVDLDTFGKICDGLFNRIDLGISPLTNTPMLGFSNVEKNRWFVKKEILSPFIGAVVQWVTEGEEVPVDGGFMREITNGGAVEFVCSITGPDYRKINWDKVKQRFLNWHVEALNNNTGMITTEQIFDQFKEIIENK